MKTFRLILLISTLVLVGCAPEITAKKIEIARRVCEPNGGLEAVGIYTFYCKNGVRGYYADFTE
jgi:hypothetical protein